MNFIALTIGLSSLLFSEVVSPTSTDMQELVQHAVVGVEQHLDEESMNNILISTTDDFEETIANALAEAEKWKDFTAYTVHQRTMPIEWQKYLYEQLYQYGTTWYFPYALCQIFQESRFNATAENPNGLDKGLCQFRITYWNEFASRSGNPGTDIWDPYAQLRVYAWLMSQNLKQTNNDVGYALSLYYLGVNSYAPDYVNDVLSHYDSLEKISQ